MKIEENNGYKTYTFEAEDVVVSRYSQPKVVQSENMKYPKHILGITWNNPETKEDEEIYVNLTPTQFKMLEDKGDLSGRTIKCRSYDSKMQKGCVAVNVEGSAKTSTYKKALDEYFEKQEESKRTLAGSIAFWLNQTKPELFQNCKKVYENKINSFDEDISAFM